MIVVSEPYVVCLSEQQGVIHCQYSMPPLVVYQILDLWVPAIGVGMIFFSLFIGMAVKVGIKLYRGKTKLIPRWFFEMLRLALPDLKRENNKNTIYSQEIGPMSFALLATITVPVILSACFITFWNVYMVEELIGDSCNPNYDCFPIINGTHSQAEPVDNCTLHIWPPDTEFECFQLVYRYAQGISATGGILFCAAIMFRIYIVSLLAPHNIQNVYCKYTCYGLVMTVGILGAVLFVLLHTSVPHFRLTVFRTVTFQIQFAVYSFTFLVVFLISGPLLIIGIEYEAPRKAKQAKAQVEDCNAKV